MEKSNVPDETTFDAYYQFILEFDTSKWTNDAKANLISIGRRLVEESRKNRSQYGPILEQLQKDYDLEVAVQALYGLRRIGDESSLKAVIKLYDRFEDKNLRKKVVVTLGYFDDPSVVDELHKIAINDPDAEVRQAAISTLSRHDLPGVIKVMEAILKSAENADERKQVVTALRRVGGDEVVPILLDVARNDVHVKVRTEAVATLSRLGTPKAQEALIELLEGK
jgi:HEAT repeat protein